MAQRHTPRPTGVPQKTSAPALLASLGCCQPRSSNARYAQARHEADAPRKKNGGDCSWCIEYSSHLHNKDNETWACELCQGPTAPCTKCGGFARQEGRRHTCLKCTGAWEPLVQKKRSSFEAYKGSANLRQELCRESPQRAQALSEGLLRPFLFLVSMSPALRLVLSIQLGWCLLAEDYCGDSHGEAWDILTRRSKGLRARCQSGASRLNPFKSSVNWSAMMTFVATTMYVPSYMNWNDEFQTEKLSSSEGADEAMNLCSPKLDALEIEFLEKVSKQHRSKMTRVQICTVAQLMTSENLRTMMTIMQQKGIDRQGLVLFAVDGNFVMLSQRFKQKRREGDDGPTEVEPEVLVAEVAAFMSPAVEGAASVFDSAHPASIMAYPPESVMSANMIPVWTIIETLGQHAVHGLGRVLPCIVSMLLQKERLKLIGITIDSLTR